MSSVVTPIGTESCPECGGHVAHEPGERACRQCGLVLEDGRIDHGPEWRSFPEDRESSSRVGAPRTERRHDHGLGSEMGFCEVDSPARMGRLRRQNRRSMLDRRGERRRAYGLGEVQRICANLELGDATIERACRIFSEGHDRSLAMGRSLDTLAAATVLAVAREQGLPLTGDQVTATTDVDASRLYKMLHTVGRETDVTTRPMEPVEYLDRVASAADVDHETRADARQLLVDVQADGVHVGRRPAGVAAAALYEVSYGHGVDVNQHELAQAADVTDTTVRNVRKAMAEAGFAEEVSL